MPLRNETLVESVPRDLKLDLASASALSAAGREMALKRLVPPETDGDEPTLIRCSMNVDGTWRVVVSEAVGLVAVGDLRLLVEPKIPRSHFEAADLRAATDRRTAHYRDALVLARNIITNVRRTLLHGERTVWTFLIRTPELVESGIRRGLQQRLERWNVRKETIPLGASRMTVAPDLVFGYGTAIGDIKYKLAESNWRRSDPYEVVAFATAAGADRAALVEFTRGSNALPPSLAVGSMNVRHFAWHADADVDPGDSAAQLAVEIDSWLSASD